MCTKILARHMIMFVSVDHSVVPKRFSLPRVGLSKDSQVQKTDFETGSSSVDYHGDFSPANDA